MTGDTWSNKLVFDLVIHLRNVVVVVNMKIGI